MVGWWDKFWLASLWAQNGIGRARDGALAKLVHYATDGVLHKLKGRYAMSDMVGGEINAMGWERVFGKIQNKTIITLYNIKKL